MKHLKACPVCGEAKFRPYSFTVKAERAKAVHFAQSHCRRCDLVFSNPVASEEELKVLYAEEYYELHEKVFRVDSPELEHDVRVRSELGVETLRTIVMPYVKSGRLFEIGAGYGPILECAKKF